MAHVVLNFNAFLEKTKLKDDGSNYMDWVRNRMIIVGVKTGGSRVGGPELCV